MYLGEEQTQENDWWSEEASVWCGPMARKAGKAFRKERTKYLKAILVLFLKKKVQTRICNQTKERVKIRGEEEKKVPILNEDFLPQNRQVKKDVAILGNLMTGIPALLILPAPLLIGKARDILHGWRQFH